MSNDIRKTVSTNDTSSTQSRFVDAEFENKELPPICGYWHANLVSLEEALDPILPRIDQLDRSIKAAKKYCQHPSKHGLTHDESAALFLYTMEGGDNSFYRILNQALRSEDRPALKPWFSYLKLLDTALMKLPTVRRAVWRGVLGDIGKSFHKNQALTWWNVTSCSLSVDVIKEFLSCEKLSTLFLIEVVHGKDISGYTNYPNENEVLLAPGIQLRVESNALDHPGGLNVVHLLEVGDENEEHLPPTVPMQRILPKSSEEDAPNTVLWKTTSNFSEKVQTTKLESRSSEPQLQPKSDLSCGGRHDHSFAVLSSIGLSTEKLCFEVSNIDRQNPRCNYSFSIRSSIGSRTPIHCCEISNVIEQSFCNFCGRCRYDNSFNM